MKRFPLNPDFVRRYAFVALLFAGMGGWFGYDGIVVYPATPAAELYESIEKSAPPPEMSSERLEAFKRQKIQSQYGLAMILLVASGWVALILLREWRREPDPDAWGRILAVDRTKWEKKGILTLDTELRGKVVLDSFHRLGVTDFEKSIAASS